MPIKRTLRIVPDLPTIHWISLSIWTDKEKTERCESATKEDGMRTWTLRLGLGLMVMAGAWPGCLPAQEATPVDVPLVVPAVPYEPAHVQQPTMPVELPFSMESDPVAPLPTRADPKPDTYQLWARSEYLLWWVKSAPLPVPIVTTGNPNVGFPVLSTAGAIGQPSTQVLLGDSAQGLGAFSGLRFTLGGWVDPGRTFGFEAGGFVLENRTATFAAGSDAAGNPPLYFPRFSPSAGMEEALPIADPLRGFAGNVTVTSALQLWGLDFNGALNVWRDVGAEFNLLAGFRYADLRESLQIHNSTTDLLFPNTETINDFFGTRNQFYGAQVGGRFSVGGERLALDMTGTLALGSTHEVVDIQGSTTQVGPMALVPPGVGTFPGGFFAQRSNIGVTSKNQFTVMPTLEFKIGYLIADCMRAYVSYDLLYWSQVVRPGSQMDHSVNLTQNAVLSPTGTGVLTGSAQPTSQFNRTDFWAQGVSFGLEFRF